MNPTRISDREAAMRQLMAENRMRRLLRWLRIVKTEPTTGQKLLAVHMAGAGPGSALR